MAAPKNPKSLKSRIDALFNALGLDERDRPSAGEIRSQLSQFALSAEKLEDGQSAAEKDATIAVLEAELGNLKVELEATKTAIDGFEAERKKQEESEREIDPTQFKILQRLASESECIWLKITEISRALNIPVDEAEIYINGLEKRGLVRFHRHEPGGGGWHRTTEGNKIVVAKRWAGEEDKETARKHPDLPPIQHEILLLIAAGQNDGANENDIVNELGKTLGLVRLNLKALRQADMASDIDEQADWGMGRVYYLRDTGAEYLAERDLL
jgi:DNA-binding MarR family transcriptional regulator